MTSQYYSQGGNGEEANNPGLTTEERIGRNSAEQNSGREYTISVRLKDVGDLLNRDIGGGQVTLVSEQRTYSIGHTDASEILEVALTFLGFVDGERTGQPPEIPPVDPGFPNDQLMIWDLLISSECAAKNWAILTDPQFSQQDKQVYMLVDSEEGLSWQF